MYMCTCLFSFVEKTPFSQVSTAEVEAAKFSPLEKNTLRYLDSWLRYL